MNLSQDVYVPWIFGLHTYATNRTLIPNKGKKFAERGGRVVYTVMTHSGNFRHEKKGELYEHLFMNFWISVKEKTGAFFRNLRGGRPKTKICLSVRTFFFPFRVRRSLFQT